MQEPFPPYNQHWPLHWHPRHICQTGTSAKHTYVHGCVHGCVHIYIYIYIYTYISIYIYIYMREKTENFFESIKKCFAFFD